MDNYEFSDEQNVKIEEVSTRLRHFIVALGLTGIVIIFQGIARWISISVQQAIPTLLIGVAACVAAYLFYQPLDNLKNIVHSTGSDIKELMIAMDDLLKAFKGFLFLSVMFLILACIRLLLLVTN